MAARGATFPTAAVLPGAGAATLVMLPSATRFMACVLVHRGPPAAFSSIAGRLAAADEEEERREAAWVDIVGRGPSPLAEPDGSP